MPAPEDRADAGCPPENQLLLYLDGALRPPASDGLEEHLAECDGCRVSVLALSGASMASERRAGAPAVDEQRPDEHVGRYRLLQPIGRGAMGVVYAAHDPELDRRVALKLIRANGGTGADPATLSARLRREAQAMARLSHRNVVTIHDVGVHRSQVFLAMELVEGTTLAGWLRARERSQQEILHAFLEAGKGLAAAHAAGLVHRDFKPENVLVGDDGRVLVTDLGLARSGHSALEQELPALDDGSAMSSSLTRSGALVGTPAYMAPEQMQGKPLDLRADVFSFCASLYEALYGERPFSAATLRELRAQMLAGAVRAAPARTSVPGWLREALLRGLRADPAERWPSITALSAVIEAHGGATPTTRATRSATSSAISSPPATASARCRRRRRCSRAPGAAGTRT